MTVKSRYRYRAYQPDQNIDEYVIKDDSNNIVLTMKRRSGDGKHVLRNLKDEVIDCDKYRHDIFNRNGIVVNS
jgi:hypothetical protein